MKRTEAESSTARQLDDRDLATAIMDISADVRRRSLDVTGVPQISNGLIDVIRVVQSHPGITVAEVATRLGRQMSNVSVQLRELVELGLVTRMRDSTDKRYVTLHPTPESQRIKALLEAEWAATLARAAGELTPEERERVRAAAPALQRLADLIAASD